MPPTSSDTPAGAEAAGRPRHGRAAPAGPGLASRLHAHLDRDGGITPGQRVVVAVSGGLDSVALLHLLRFGLEGWGLEPIVAHFDHRMRPGSETDALWTAGLCRAWDLPLVVGRADAPLRSEAAARDARYAFLYRVTQDRRAHRLVTAHHADDQAETVLFRIARGTGIPGLRGIAPRRGPLVRPLLPFRRAEIADYAAAVGLRFREDPTNRLLEYARNRLRHEVLPALESVAPGAAGALARLAAVAREAEAAWEWVVDRLEAEAVEGRAEDGFVLARSVVLSYHPYLRARLLRRLLGRLGSRPDRAGTRAALEFINFGSSGGEFRVAGGLRLEREFDRIRIHREPAVAPRDDRPLTIQVPGAGTGRARIGGHTFAVEWGPDVQDGEAFRLPELGFPLEVRGWRPGDRIRLAYGTKKLKKVFAERRVGRTLRRSTPVLAEREGRVLWVPGVARAAVAEPDAGPFFRVVVRHAE